MQPPRAHIPALAPITLVGSGRVGNVLARALEDAGHDVRLAGRDGFDEACTGAETVLLCVPDAEIGAACSRAAALSPALRFIGHTSGATGLETLSPATVQGAEGFSLHPLQTVPDAGADLTGAPAAIAGTSPGAVEVARSLARDCQMLPFEIPEGSRTAYHAAASMASNFLIALEVSAEELLGAAGVEDGRELLAPLVLRTAANWAESGSTALTGPIARGDEETVRRHLAAIEDLAPELADTYRALAERTRSVASTGERT